MPRPKGSKNRPKADMSPKSAPKAKEARAKFKAPVNTKTGAAGAAVAGPKGAPAAGLTQQETVRAKATPAGTIKSLLSTCRGLKANMDEVNAKLREEIGYAKEKKHLHTKAFADLRKIDKMVSDNAERGAEYWSTLLYYLDVSGVMAKIDAVARLPLGDEPDAPPASDRVEEDGEDDAEAAAETAQEHAGEAEEAKAHANGNGAAGGAPASDEAPLAPNVSRPKFGQRSEPQSQSAKADAIAERAGTKH